ncbi:MFS transporter [Slackia heliotrinireducens]|uniref:MFS transporter n=1 Tax=Slackia heliotrinireducens TaxID=84110 RepID=UPI0033154128
MAEGTSKLHRGWAVVVACCLIMMFPCGFSFNAASVYYPYVAEALTGGNTAPVGLYMSIIYITMAVCLLFMGKVFAEKNASVVLSVSVAAIALGFVLMATATSIKMFYVAAILLGFGNSTVLYLMIPVLIGRWFKVHNGLLIGIGTAFSGVAGMLWSPVATSIILNHGYQAGYWMYAILSAIVGLFCTLVLIRTSPESCGVEPYGADQVKDTDNKPAVLEGVTVKTALSQPGTLILIALYAGLVNLGLTMNYYLPTYVKSLEMYAATPEVAAAVGAALASATMFGTLIGKVLLGFTNDKSTPGSIIFGLLCGIIGLLLVLFGPSVNIVLAYVGGFLFGIFFASSVTTTPQLARKVFGGLNYSQIYSYITAVCALLAAFGSTFWGVIYDTTGNFVTTFFVDIAFMALAFVLGFAGMKAGKSLPRETQDVK